MKKRIVFLLVFLLILTAISAVSEDETVVNPECIISGHLWDSEGTVTKPASCTTVGETTYYCTRTGCQAVKTEANIPKLMHAFAEKIVQKPSCKEGLVGISVMACRVCGFPDSSTYKVYDPGQHEWYSEEIIKVKPTCTKNGEKVRICRVCNTIESSVIPMLGHDYGDTLIQTKTPTCMEKGVKTGYCLVCKKEITSEIDYVGHNWEIVQVTSHLRTRYCTVCK